MADSDILTALQPVVAALDEMGVAYEIGGSGAHVTSVGDF
jgi:hypothetical protein